ncbi:MAG: hypothetical protein AAFR44_01830, partial [Pseudomonadota bacterium]
MQEHDLADRQAQRMPERGVADIATRIAREADREALRHKGRAGGGERPSRASDTAERGCKRAGAAD